MMQASYSVTRLDVPYVTNSMITSGSACIGCVDLTTFDPNAELFGGNQTWDYLTRLSGYYQLPYGLSAAVNYENRSNTRWARTQTFRAHDAAAVVRVHARCGGRVALGEERVRALGAELVVGRLPPLPFAGSGRRGQLEVGERRAQVEPGAADHDRRPPRREDLVNGGVGEALVVADRDVVAQRHEPDEPRGVVGRRGQDRDSGIERGRVRRHDLRVETLAQDSRDGGLAARRGPVDREKLRRRLSAPTLRTCRLCRHVRLRRQPETDARVRGLSQRRPAA